MLSAIGGGMEINMKTVIINVTREYGSTGQLASNLYKKMNDNGNEAYLFYGRYDEENEDNNIIRFTTNFSIKAHAVMSYITGMEGYFSYFTTKNMISQIEKICPDLVVIYNLVGYYINTNLLFEFLNKNHIYTICCMIDESMYCGKCCYPDECTKYKSFCDRCPKKEGYPKSIFFDTAKIKQIAKRKMYGQKNNYTFIGPEYVVNRAKESMILRDAHIEIVDEAINTECFRPKKIAILKQKYNIPEKDKVVINVCPVSNKRKGAQYYFKAIEEIKDQNITFIHIGCDTDNIKYPEKLVKVGYVYDQNVLADYLSMSDIFVCTSTNDTMPNICLDSMACGTPIIGFNCSGIPFIAEEPIGCFVEEGNYRELANAIKSMKKKDEDTVKKCRDYAIKRYSFDTYYNKIIEIYNNAFA